LIALLGVIFGFKETLPNPDIKKIKVESTDRESLSFLRSRSVKGVFVMYSLQVFCNTDFAETYPLWSWSDKEHGGLAFHPAEIGTTMTYAYIVMVCVQSALYSGMQFIGAHPCDGGSALDKPLQRLRNSVENALSDRMSVLLLAQF